MQCIQEIEGAIGRGRQLEMGHVMPPRGWATWGVLGPL